LPNRWDYEVNAIDLPEELRLGARSDGYAYAVDVPHMTLSDTVFQARYALRRLRQDAGAVHRAINRYVLAFFNAHLKSGDPAAMALDPALPITPLPDAVGERPQSP
jgi:hypothetical protein